MKKALPIALFLLAVAGSTFGQAAADFNLDLERWRKGQRLPDQWVQWGQGYEVLSDSVEKLSGHRSVVMRAPQEIPSGAFGCIASTFPAVYEGKQIELRGYMKFSGVENGFAGLMLRIDGNAGTLQFNNMQNEGLKGTQDWKQYRIQLPYPDQATKIHIGALLAGKGTLWVDGFEVLIDGKTLSEASLRKQAPALADKEFDNGSGLIFPSLTPALVNDLAYAGKLWGFLKYYHPAIAKGDFNWDYELFRMLPGLMQARTEAEKQKIIAQWIRKPGPVSPGTLLPTDKAVVKPNLEWIKKPRYGQEVSGLLEMIRAAARSDEKHYYVALAPGVGNPEFRNEDPYAKMSYPDAGFRLLSLFRYWNIIEYFFPYKPLIKESWDAVLREFVPKFLEARDEAAYQLAALELICRVKDTHATLMNPGKALEEFRGARFPAADISYVEGKPVVVDFLNPSLAEASGMKPGDVIERVNGREVEALISDHLPYTPGSNRAVQLRSLSATLLRTNDPSIKVRVRRENRMVDLTVPTYGKDKVNLYANYFKQDTCFKQIGPDIAYLFPGKFKNGYLPVLAPEIRKSKALIIDLRCYPSDFMVFTVGNLLLPAAKPFVKFTTGSLQQPGMFSFTPPLSVGGDNPDYYKGKIVILVNELTLSQSEYTAMALSQAPGAIIVGSTTAGADGNISWIILPGNIRTAISGIGVYYPDGRETQQVGIIPDVEVHPTIQGIREGRDEVLEKALELLK